MSIESMEISRNSSSENGAYLAEQHGKHIKDLEDILRKEKLLLGTFTTHREKEGNYKSYVGSLNALMVVKLKAVESFLNQVSSNEMEGVIQ